MSCFLPAKSPVICLGASAPGAKAPGAVPATAAGRFSDGRLYILGLDCLADNFIDFKSIILDNLLEGSRFFRAKDFIDSLLLPISTYAMLELFSLEIPE